MSTSDFYDTPTPYYVVVVAVLVMAGVFAWRQARRASQRQALMDQAEKASTISAAFVEKEYGLPGTTTDEIFSREDSKILGALNYWIGQKAENCITEAERRLVAVYRLVGEVGNGGFDQYFFNSTGNNSADALAGLKAMGATGAAALLERAMAVFPGGKAPTDRQQRWQAMEKIQKHAKAVWEQCDNEFYQLKEDPYELALAFAKTKRADIVLP